MNTVPLRATGPLRTRLPARTLAWIVVGLILCLAVDTALLLLIRSGPPAGKSDLFFLELGLVIVASICLAAGLVINPARTWATIPALFIVLAWHTGLQLSLSSRWPVVISVFDLAVPPLFLLAVLGGLHRALPQLQVLAPLKKPLIWYYVFCLWGFAVAVARGVPTAPMLTNFRSLTLYPLIMLLIVYCIRTRRQLLITSLLMLALILERALEGIRQGSSASTTALLGNGEIVSRITGNLASVNQYAAYILTGLFIILGLMLAGSSLRSRVALVMPLLVTIVAVFLTYSRGAWLASGVAVLALAFLMSRMSPRRTAAFMGSLVLAYLLFSSLDSDVKALAIARINGVDHSIVERQNYAALGLNVVRHYPLGAGWGAAFTSNASGVQEDTNPNTYFPWYHDDYLQLATEIGIPGLAVFLWIWFVILRLAMTRVRNVRASFQTGILVGCFAAVVALLVQAGTEQFFWHPDIAPHIWIVAGLLLAALSLTHESTSADVAARDLHRSHETLEGIRTPAASTAVR